MIQDNIKTGDDTWLQLIAFQDEKWWDRYCSAVKNVDSHVTNKYDCYNKLHDNSSNHGGLKPINLRKEN